MERVLLAWELGANFGHLVALRALARVLIERGHECIFAVRQLGNAHEFLGHELGPILQAPARLGAPRNPVKTQVSYSSVLHNIGFDEPVELAGRIAAWRNLMQAVRADYVFADLSPIALIAARTLGTPACNMGTGWALPPLAPPFPSFRPRMNIAQSVLANNDATVLKELNQALEQLKLKPFSVLQEVLSAAHPALLSYPELDHYEGQRPEPFLGIPDMSHGDAPEWPTGNGKKVLAYLRPTPGLVHILQALKDSKARVLLRAPGIPDATIKSLARPGLAFVSKTINFQRAAEQCDAYVTYGAHGTIAEFMLAGKPGLLIPDVHERVLVSRRAVALGAAVAARPGDAEGIRKGLARVLEDPAPLKIAQDFAAKYAGQDRGQILPKLVDSLF